MDELDLDQQKATHRRADFAFSGTVVLAIIGIALFYVVFPEIAALLLVAGLLAYALLPIVDKLAKKLPRWLSVAIVGVGVLALLAGAFAVAVPLVSKELKNSDEITQRVKEMGKSGWAKLKGALPDKAEPKAQEMAAATVESAKQQTPTTEKVTEYAKKSGHVLAGVTSALVFIPAFVVLMLLAYHRFWRMMMEAVPTRYRGRFKERGQELDTALSGFIRGQLLNALILAVLYSVAFSIIGIPLAVVVGMLAGFGELIPYVGNTIGLVLGTLLAFAGGNPMDALWVVATFGVLQLLEATVLAPLVVGKKAHLRPMALLVALAIGGQLFGIIGLLLAVPVTAALKVATKVAVSAWQRTTFFERQAA